MPINLFLISDDGMESERILATENPLEVEWLALQRHIVRVVAGAQGELGTPLPDYSMGLMGRDGVGPDAPETVAGSPNLGSEGNAFLRDADIVIDRMNRQIRERRMKGL